LVQVRAPHPLGLLLSLLLTDTPLFADDLHEHLTDLASHVRRIATYVEIGFLLQELVDQSRILLHAVLDVDLIWLLSAEGGDEFELVAKGFFEFLWMMSQCDAG
jgi:hypothetical protein